MCCVRLGALAEEGLGAALAKHAAAVTAREGLDISVHAPEQRLALAVEQEEHLYRLAQEALHNVVKHAGAQRAWVELDSRAGPVVMTMRDDGAGVDPAEPRPGHLGLRTMEDRAAKVRGRLAVRRAPGAGTTVRIELRLAAE
jgi:signal transduction histidine kinase